MEYDEPEELDTDDGLDEEQEELKGNGKTFD